MEQSEFIDWGVAAKVGAGIVPPGPVVSPDEAAEVVASIRAAAEAAPAHVSQVTGLDDPADARTLVVDRPAWVAACARSSEAILNAIESPLTPGLIASCLGRVQGGGVGLVLAAASTRVLGQFDPFSEPPTLLLVAPNMVAAERSLAVDPADFRLWVCLHEQTHRFQFGHAPWLRGHLTGLISALLDGDSGFLAFWGRSDKAERGKPFIDRMLNPAQRDVFDQITAVMSLIEGYADVMMDRAGVGVIPTLPAIRRAFETRRDRGGWTAVLGKLIGTDLKLAQYREGAAFCRAVIDEAGVDVLNVAWSAPDTLPSLVELRDPQRWLARVHG